MSVLVRRPALLSMENAKLLRYSGVTKNSKLIHTRFIASTQDNIRETNALINLYSKSAAMPGHFQNGLDFEVLRLFKSMVSESCPPNEYISSSVISSCLNVRFLSLGRQCHGYLLKSGLVFNKYVKTPLVRLYSMLSDVVGAMEVSVCDHGLALDYNIMLIGLVEKGYLDEALIILRRMLAEEEDVVLSKDTYISIFGLCARLKDLKLGRQVHNKLLKSDDAEFDESVCISMINMYGKCGHLLSARKVLIGLKPRNVVIWNELMAAYLEHGCLMDSYDMLLHMQFEDVSPNEFTFCLLLTISAEAFSMRFGKLVHARTHKSGFMGHKNVEDTLIEMYARTGDIESAEKVFLDATYNNHRDITTWNAMINGYSLHGFGIKSLALFQEMLELGEDVPNKETFVGVLSACGHMGVVELGFYYLYEVMKQNGVEPGLEHYMCIINMLIKAGQLNEALSFIVSTPGKWDWSTLLRVCRDHGHYDLGIRVAELIPDDDVAAAKWRELIKTRKNTKEERGTSWVEIEAGSYEFDSVDKGDPEFVGNHALIEITHQIIRFAFSKLGIHVGHDEMKRDCDDYIPSEEIAVAIALFKTPLMAPICIIKSSGKIGSGSHFLIKLLSKASFRPITLRDTYQVHNFQDGRCSCADYW